MKSNRYGGVVRSESISKDRENFFNKEIVVSIEKKREKDK